VKPNVVLIQGLERSFPIGHYVLRHHEGRRSVWTRIEGSASDALAAMNTAQKKTTARIVAKDADLKVDESDTPALSIKASLTKYVDAATARGALEAAEVVERAVNEFMLTCKKSSVDQITRDDVVKWQASMRKRGLSDRTVYNRHLNFRSFCLFASLDADAVCGPSPRYEEQAVEIYEDDDLKPFFAALTTEYDKLLFGVLLACGLREQEAMHLEWRSINWTARTLRVQSNPRYDFKVKDAEQRDVPVPADLLNRLKAYRETQPTQKLVFGKRGGRDDAPDGHLLRRLKGLARSAELNCGECEGCTGKNKECGFWYLHRFRSTYITRLLRSGVDIRTVMKLSGHSDLESIMRYLRPSEDSSVQLAVNNLPSYL
jgi:integrase